MQKLFESKKQCFGCSACQNVCPCDAVVMKADAEGFLYPEIREEKCVDCGKCGNVCPIGKSFGSDKPKAYAMRTNDAKLLSASTSGGAFSLIAKYILQKGGIVCGAVFDADLTVKHVLSADISGMRKSKYVQSDISDCPKEIRDALNQGKTVLFSGTPCQCHAIKNLFPDNDGLFLAALICRGVLSPELWKEYLHYLSADSIPDYFCFRDKRIDNDAHTVAWSINGTEHTNEFQRDPFCRIYSKELPLRPSCYACPYTTPLRDFDFTIGDFWGIKELDPALDDGKGTSLVLAHSRRAALITEEIQKSGEAMVLPADDEKSWMQIALEQPAKETMLRRFLYKDLSTRDGSGHCNMELILKKYGF